MEASLDHDTILDYNPGMRRSCSLSFSCYRYIPTSLLMLLLCTEASWGALRMRGSRRQQAALMAIQNVGGLVEFDNEVCPLIPACQRRLLRRDWPRAYVGWHLTAQQVSDVTLSYVAEMPALRWLSLKSTGVTDDGLRHLKGLHNLIDLSLDNTRVTDAGLRNLEGLTQLAALSLNKTQVTDAGMRHLHGLTKLVVLSLNDTKLTDAGLDQLTGLPQLVFLSLENTGVTEEGVNGLEKALPKCSILHARRNVLQILSH